MNAKGENRTKWWVLFVVGISTFMTALDTSVVNTVLPMIGEDLKSPIAHVEWVITVYLLILSGLLLSFGRLGDIRGHRKIYTAGFAMFTLCSALCGAAQNVSILIICRAFQALGAAMLAANSPAILTKSFPSKQRGQALGLQATMTYLGLTVGPALGGWLAAQFGWRYVFYLNVPIGIIAIWLCFHVISIDLDTRTAERFDLAGAGLFLVSLSLFLLGLNQGYIWGWNSPIFLGVLTGAIFLMINFLWVEYRAQAAMLELSLFANRAFSQAVLSAIFNYIGVYSVIFLMPFYLLQGHGLSPDTAGLLLSAQPIIMTIIAPISGTLSDHIGTRLPTTFGMLGLTVGLYLLSSLNEYSTSGEIILALATVGLGTGTFISPNNSALMGSAPRNRQGIAAGILATARNLGMVLGVGLTGAIFTTLLSGPFIPGGESPLFVAIRYSFLMAGVFTIFGALTSAVHFPSQS